MEYIKIRARIELPKDKELEKKEYITNVIIQVNSRVVYSLTTTKHIRVNRRDLRLKLKKISKGDIIKFTIKYSNGDIKERKYLVTMPSKKWLWSSVYSRIGITNEK